MINHGKKDLWKRGSGYHYHATLQAGYYFYCSYSYCSYSYCYYYYYYCCCYYYY